VFLIDEISTTKSIAWLRCSFFFCAFSDIFLSSLAH
jgi:hypothetical protein